MSSDKNNSSLILDLKNLVTHARSDEVSDKSYRLNLDMKFISSNLHGLARRYDYSGLREVLKNDSSDVNLKDNGQTPLHAVLADGIDSARFLGHLNENDMVACINVLNSYGADLNANDGLGNTPLSLAVDNRFRQCTRILLENGAKCSSKIATKIAHSMPDVLLEIFDSGVSLDADGHGDVMVKLDWRPVLQFPDTNAKDAEERKKFKDVQKETQFLYSLLEVEMTSRKKLLKHPLVAAFLYFKGRKMNSRYVWFYVLTVFYPLLYMLFIYFLYFERCKLEVPLESSDTSTSTTTGSPRTAQSHCTITLAISIASYFLATVIFVWALVELYMQIKVDRKYLTGWRTWVIRIAIIVMGVTLWPGLQINDVYDITFQYPIASVGIFLGWVMFLLQIGLFDKVSIYLEMLVKILLSVVKITLMFMPLFIGFFMGFNLMFSDMSGLFSYIMMTVDVGAVAYDKLINEAKEDAYWFRILAYTFCVGFIIIIVIVFMNFLLALSIKDVEALKGQAKMASISRRLQNLFTTDLIDPYSALLSRNQTDEMWFYRYYPTDRDAELPEEIRLSITLLLKEKKFKRVMEEEKKSETEMIQTGDENLRNMAQVLMRRIQELERKVDAVSNRLTE